MTNFGLLINKKKQIKMQFRTIVLTLEQNLTRKSHPNLIDEWNKKTRTKVYASFITLNGFSTQ